jgi:hypothetical protein
MPPMSSGDRRLQLSIDPRSGTLHTGAVNIRLLAAGALHRAIPVGADVQVSGVVFARYRSADRALPPVR